MSEVVLQVARGSTLRHFVNVTSPGVVSWSWSSAGYDVGVGCIWHPEISPAEAERTESPTRQQIQPQLRLESDSSSYGCITTGTMEFVFDNSYSLMRGKTVTLKLSKAALPADYEVIVPAPLVGAAVPYDVEAANIAAYKGVRMFFCNQFAPSETYFAREKSRIPIFALSWCVLRCSYAVRPWPPLCTQPLPLYSPVVLPLAYITCAGPPCNSCVR